MLYESTCKSNYCQEVNFDIAGDFQSVPFLEQNAVLESLVVGSHGPNPLLYFADYVLKYRQHCVF